jgi:hypothetical protein
MGVVRVTQRTLLKSNHGVNRVIPNVKQQGRLTILCNLRVERAYN